VPDGAPVAYGLAAMRDNSVVIERVALHGGGYGFFATGALSITDGVATGHGDAAGARGPDAVLTLERFVPTGNARDDVVENGGLPEASALPPPAAVDL
jgi:hypothetical protein